MASNASAPAEAKRRRIGDENDGDWSGLAASGDASEAETSFRCEGIDGRGSGRNEGAACVIRAG